jgi:Helicase conserved C-terminal domain/SNF2-related domain
MLVTSNYFKELPGKRAPIIFDIPVTVNINPRLKYTLHNQFFNKIKRTIVSKATKLDRDIYLVQVEKNIKERRIVNTTEKKSKKLTEKSMVSDIDVDEEIMEKYKHYLNHPEFNIEKLYPNTRLGFLNEIQRKLSGIQFKVQDEASCKSKDKNKPFERMIHQEIVRRYINSYTPYRGILLYHGLGSGKTCSSISLIEGMMTSKRIYVITPASLQANYRTQIKFCGEQLFRTDHHWVFERIDYISDFEKKKAFTELSGIHKASIELNKFIKERKGLWFIKEGKSSNFKDLSIKEQEDINLQIEIMIRAKYYFMNYNGLTMKSWNKNYKITPDTNPFDNSTVIIDEVHNFINSVLNKLNIGRKSVSTELYEHIMDAENCRVIVLTGTPYINYPSELGCLFNLINGYTKTVDVKVNSIKSVLTQSYFENLFKSSGMVDIIEYNQNNSVVRFIKNPYGFIKDTDGKMIYDERGDIYMKEFTTFVVEKLREQKDILNVVSVSHSKFTKLPQTTKRFNELFVTPDNKMKLKEFFQRRIIGLVSYLGDKRELMPDMIKAQDKEGKETDIHMEYVSMSPHQVVVYDEIRVSERKQEKYPKMKPKKGEEEKKSSYRVFSRSACNFAFPAEMPRPMPTKKDNKGEMEFEEDEIDAVSETELINDERYNVDDAIEKKIELKNVINIDEYANEIAKVLREFENNPSQYFETNIEKYIKHSATDKTTLDIYSPKFVRILKNMMNPENQGCQLLYTNFRKLEGIGLFRIALLYHGYKELKILKNTNGDYIATLKGMYDDNQYTDTKVFALYTGTETAEEREIIRNIYNNDHSKLPHTIQKDLKRIYKDLPDGNLYGEMIQLLMITASGAEGIDLKNVRFVHIMEPYWHHVRINQVIGRARRICSHANLPEEMQTVKVFMYISVLPEEVMKTDKYIDLKFADNGLTTDENLYIVMDRKHKLSQMFLDSLKEASIDCIVNHSKCYHFPGQITKNTKLITEIDYTQAATGEVVKQEAETTAVQHKIIVRKFVVDGEEMPFAVDEEKGVVYDYLQFKKSQGQTKIRVGVLDKNKKLVLDI